MTLDEINRLRELAQAATTPRPWKPDEVGEAFRWLRKMGNHETFTTQDGGLAAAAVNALPALLAVVEAAEVIATTHAPLRNSEVLRTVRVDQVESLTAALRALKCGGQ